MINISKSKTRNRAILNAVYHACDDYPAADFCIRNRHLIVRKSRCVTSISTSISLILLLFLFFHFYNSKNTTPVLRVPFSSPGSFISSIITSSSRVTPIVPLSLAPIMHSLSLSFFSSSFFFFFHFHSSVSYALRSNISSPGTHAPIVKRHPSDSEG